MKKDDATRSVRPIVLMAFLFVSGAAALGHEVAWVRLLSDVFGTTAGATAVVLACFMGGMGGGALVLGRRADRSPDALRLYGILEIAAGLLALLVPIEARLFAHVYGALFRAAGPEAMWLLAPARVGLAAVALLPPAFALGGTLPVLVRFMTSRASGPGGIGFDVGRLYAANTAGAVAGCFGTGYLLIANLGVLGTVILAGALSIAVGAAALLLSRGLGARPGGPAVEHAREGPDPGEASPGPLPRRWIVPALYGASGFVALGCEVLWTRALVFLLHSTVYAFTSMLTVFLIGLACGGAVGALVSRRVRRPVLAFAALEAGVAASVALGLVVLRAFAAEWVSIDLALGSGWRLSVVLHLALAAAVMIVPTFLFGMIFPVVARIYCVATRPGVRSSGATEGAVLRGPDEGGRAGASTGELLFANTIGGVAGSIAAGFVMIPFMGTAHSILALAALSLFIAAGAAAFLTEGLGRVASAALVVSTLFVSVPVTVLFGTVPAILALAPVGLFAAAALFTRARRAVRLRAPMAAGLVSLTVLAAVPPGSLTTLFGAPNPRAKLVYADEGPGGIVTVHRYSGSGYLLMSVNGVSIAGTAGPLRSTQALQGLIPSLLHPAPRRVLQIGIGTGETSRVALRAGAERITCIEISPEVVRATRGFFGPLSRGVLADPRYSLLFADGKNYVRHARERFDLILSDSTYPFLSGSSGLYTLDYYRDCRARLAPGGMVSAWIPLDLPRRGLGSVLRTFAEAFPHATLWTTSGYAYKHALLLGSAGPIHIRYSDLAEAAGQRAFADPLARSGIPSVEDFAAGLMLDREGMLECARGAPLHTDDRPILEYETALRAGSLWRERLAENMAELSRARSSLLEHVDLSGLEGAERADIEGRLVAAGGRAREATDALVARLRVEARAFPFINNARRAWRRGALEEAVRLYRRGLTLNPADDKASREILALYTRLGRLQEGLHFIESVRGRAEPGEP